MKRVYVILLFATLILCGCIKEDRSRCPRSQNTLLKFKYEESGVDVFPEHISSVNLFLFTASDGRFVQYKHIDELSLSRFRGVELDLPNGQYRVVSFANVHELTQIPSLNPSCQIDDITKVHLLNLHIDPITGNFETGDRLFYGPRGYLQPFVVTVSNQQNTQYDLFFRAAHVEIDVYVTGFEDQAHLPPIVELTNMVTEYDFKLGTFGDPVTYKQTSHQENIHGVPTQAATFYTPLFGREDDNIDVVLRRSSNNEIFQTINLKQFIDTNYPNVDLASEEEAKIEIEITYKNGNVKITMPSWIENEIIPEI